MKRLRNPLNSLIVATVVIAMYYGFIEVAFGHV